jgi:F-type H+-transporting ATPase subunit b
MDTFYVGVGFVIFVGILYKVGAFGMLTGALDARGVKISEQLAQASSLRAEAEKLLAEYEAKRAAAEIEAKRIVDDAKAEAERTRIDQEAKLADFVIRRTRLAEQKIAPNCQQRLKSGPLQLTPPSRPPRLFCVVRPQARRRMI